MHFLPFQAVFFLFFALGDDGGDEHLPKPVEGELVHVPEVREAGHHEIEQGASGSNGEVGFACRLSFTFCFFGCLDAL